MSRPATGIVPQKRHRHGRSGAYCPTNVAAGPLAVQQACGRLEPRCCSGYADARPRPPPAPAGLGRAQVSAAAGHCRARLFSAAAARSRGKQPPSARDAQRGLGHGRAGALGPTAVSRRDSGPARCAARGQAPCGPRGGAPYPLSSRRERAGLPDRRLNQGSTRKALPGRSRASARRGMGRAARRRCLGRRRAT